MIAEKTRKTGFWIADFLKNGHIRKQYHDIKAINENPSAFWQRRQTCLAELLEFAVTQSGFYRPYHGYSSLADFPVINKNTIRAQYDQFITDPHRNMKLHPMSTSGSTGTPFTILQDPDKRNRVRAEVIYYGAQCGYHVGDRMAYLRLWTKANRKSRLDAWKQNLIMLENSRMDEESLEEIRQICLQDHRLRCIVGHAKSLEVLACHMQKMGDHPALFSVRAVISIAELLTPFARQSIEQVFDCRVVSRYSNQENGILAQEMNQPDRFMPNHACYHFEFLKMDSDEPAAEGEPARVVVTDLFNHAMPMIRYDTGDLATVENTNLGPVITSIEGRKTDFIFDTAGKLLSPHIIMKHMWQFVQIQQYQLIQTNEREYVLKVNKAREHYDDEALVKMTQSLVGSDAAVSIQHMEGIPLLASGKFQITVNQYKPYSQDNQQVEYCR